MPVRVRDYMVLEVEHLTSRMSVGDAVDRLQEIIEIDYQI